MRVLQQIKELDDLPGRYVLLVVYGCRMEQERMGAGFAAVKKVRGQIAHVNTRVFVLGGRKTLRGGVSRRPELVCPSIELL